MQNRQNDPKQTPWTIAACLLFFLPPLGLMYTIYLCGKEKTNHEYGVDRIQGPATAAIAAGIFEIILMVSIQKDIRIIPTILITFGLTLVGGFLMLGTRKRYIQYDERVDLCMTLVEKGYLTDTAEIAEYMSLSRENVEDLLTSLMEKHELTGFILDREMHLLRNTNPYKYFRYKCKYCGADQQLMRGRDITCPYCGNPVNE